MHQLLDTLIRYFDGDATLDDVRAAASEACRAMRYEGVDPQMMLSAFRGALRAAAEHAHIPVNVHAVATLRGQLTPLMVDLCFAAHQPRPFPRRPRTMLQ